MHATKACGGREIEFHACLPYK